MLSGSAINYHISVPMLITSRVQLIPNREVSINCLLLPIFHPLPFVFIAIDFAQCVPFSMNSVSPFLKISLSTVS